MASQLRLHDHVFTSTRAGQVTLLSLQSDTVLRIRGPVVEVWSDLINKGRDIHQAATQLGLHQDALVPLLAALAAHGFAAHDQPASTAVAESLSWDGVGTLEVEILGEQYGEAYAGFHNLMGSSKPGEKDP
jgi:hypothetical protein